ncbi:MAG: RNA polymerase sigma-70 factor [Prevotella sp.]|nr:RNA polymerase sigma-70 factor [Prevotella sp.]MDD7462543.1 RNA polymerase sigma-70 factor [Prevotellaceae bacterium]MDY3366073.1 RNA polymerase sigma-70 factor [Prevotella sp.]MDY3852716.1 RNA polymerase sigma-70 factor [Prevotella sp.]
MENKSSAYDDSHLLSLMNKGEKEGFDAIFHKYYRPLCCYAYQFVCLEDVEEVVQDVLLGIWENHEKLFIRTSLHTYLFRAVRLRCLTRIEQNTAIRRRETHYWKQYMENTTVNPDEFQTEELIKRINEAINQLPEKFRQAFVMHRFQDYSYKEIAETLGVSPKTIDYRIQQALKLLQKDLKQYYPFLLLLYQIHRS